MIENKLTNIEFKSVLTPILKLEDTKTILSAFENVFQEKIKTFDEIIEYTRRYNLTYKGFKIFISGIGDLSENSVYISLNCRIEKKWSHIFNNPTHDFIKDIQEICKQEIPSISFFKTEMNVYPPNSYSPTALEKLTYIIDSVAFNLQWKEGSEISPLIIAPSQSKNYHFLEFIFNSNCYFRNDERTSLKKEWKSYIPDITNYIERVATERMKYGFKK